MDHPALAIAVVSAVTALVLSLQLAGKGYRRLWLLFALAIALAAFAAASFGESSAVGYGMVMFFAPWLAWVPLSLVYGASRRLISGQSQISGWLYVATVVSVSVATGLAVQYISSISPSPLPTLIASIGLILLVYPAGVVGSLVAAPLVLTGIATPTEGYALAAPVFAIAGYLQWYCALPRIAIKRCALAANPSVKGTCLRQAPYVER